MLRFHSTWAALALFLFAVEVCIALFVHDRFVRPYVGDVLVVMLLFFAVLSVAEIPARLLAGAVLTFAVVVEITQAFGLIHRLGLSDNTLAKLVLGNTFQWGDLACYVIGSIASVAVVHAVNRKGS